MRWYSVDQKPSWFNNAGQKGNFAVKGSKNGSVRENFAKTRQRYTIMTGVPSWLTADEVPKMAVLFKGAKGGRIVGSILKDFDKPDWMKLQTQEFGSYRSEDVVEYLQWALPAASSSKESIIVILDWYTGHRTPEVERLISDKGHVLLFHGGGTTPFTQINDTHLHALVQRLLETIENQWALSRHEEAEAEGKTSCPIKLAPTFAPG